MRMNNVRITDIPALSGSSRIVPVRSAKGNVLIGQLGPLMFVSKYMGVLPLTKSGPDTFKFRYRSFIMMYSVSLFVVISVTVSMSSLRLFHYLLNSVSEFNELVLDILQLLYVHQFWVIPFCDWRDGRSAAQYLNEWSIFQEMYIKTTGYDLELNLKRKLKFTIGTMIIFTFMSGIVRPNDWQPLLVIPTLFQQLHINIVAAWWYLNCQALVQATDKMRGSLMQVLCGHEGGSPMEVAKHRILWIRLSKLARQLGDSQPRTYGHFCLFMFCTLTMAAYGAICDVGKNGLAANQTWIGAICIHSALMLYIVCNSSHIVTDQVGSSAMEEVLLLNLTSLSVQTKQEVELLLSVMSMSPPIISLNGYVQLNRSTFLSMLATVVTYLVVLIQFQSSWVSPPGTKSSIYESSTKSNSVGSFDTTTSVTL